MEFFEENPISIKEVENIESDIESFQTEVTVYSMNNRMDISSRLQTKYKLSLKKINGVQYSRLDFFPEFTNGLARSVISDDVQMILQDGTTVTTNTYPMYQEIEDIPIKIGSVTVINSKAKEFLPGFENIEYFESIDDIPEISEQEYNSLLESETTEKVESLLFGNPADLSYEETIVEVYNNIEINTIEDSLFKIFINNE